MKSKKLFVAAALAAAAGLVSLLDASDARACGGCFGEQPSVVTDHRMVLAVSQGQTTLYDQVRYQGNPAEFAWVLPVRGGTKVELSHDEFFAALDAATLARLRCTVLVVG